MIESYSNAMFWFNNISQIFKNILKIKLKICLNLIFQWKIQFNFNAISMQFQCNFNAISMQYQQSLINYFTNLNF